MDDQDKPLENLFRDKAETFSDLSYREEDWNKLEKRLDKLDLKKIYRRKIAILAAASVLLVGLMGYFMVTNHHKINEISEQVSQLEETQKSDSAAEADQMAKPEITENSSILAEGESNDGFRDSSPKETKLDEISKEKSPNTRKAESLSAMGTENFNKDLIIEKADRYVLAQNTLLEENQTYSIKNENVYSLRETTYGPLDDEIFAYATGESGTRQIASGMDSQHRPSLTIGFMLSPDLSTAGTISNFDKPGFKGGVLAELSFSDRISVRSGAIFSNVRYKAGQNDYRAPENWNYGVSPDQTTALCLILDIPVTLKATMIQLDRSNFYVTGGVSTYVMLSEEYKFDYGTNASPYLTSEWQGKTGDRFWASNLSFSIGYEMDISDRVALRAEPHLYVPLREVGWGNVKLYSIGTSVSLNVRM
jgi:hypothetical protein